MSDFKPGLEGVVAFETEIAEPDKEGGSLRYRGVDIEELVGHVSFGHVWGLLVDNAFGPGLPPAEPLDLPVRTGDVRVDVQSGVAALGAALGPAPAARHLARAGARGRRPGLRAAARVHRRSRPAAPTARRSRSGWSTRRRPRPRPSSSAGAASRTRGTCGRSTPTG